MKTITALPVSDLRLVQLVVFLVLLHLAFKNMYIWTLS